jgi:hypothetical protein
VVGEAHQGGAGRLPAAVIDALGVFYDLCRDVIKVTDEDGLRNDHAVALIESIHTAVNPQALNGRPSALSFGRQMTLGLLRYVRNKLGQFQSGNQAMLEANKAEPSRYLKAKRSAEILRQGDQAGSRPAEQKRGPRGVMTATHDAHEVTSSRSGCSTRSTRSTPASAASTAPSTRAPTYWPDSGRYVALCLVPRVTDGGGPARPASNVNYQAAYADPFGARVRITKPGARVRLPQRPVRNFKAQGIYAHFVRHAF